ncbi:MAG: hypothetical protein HY718_06220, partial [Planctomycetes bacterium]|nr:hypothetical protein [Planctomycetota bacterium]
VFYPNEVIDPVTHLDRAVKGPARITNAYILAGVFADRLDTQLWGGTNDSGIPAGGLIDYDYLDLGAGSLSTPSLESTILDRNGNRSIYRFNHHGNCLRREELTNRDVRGPEAAFGRDDPASFITTWAYNDDEELIGLTLPLQNQVLNTFDSANLDRYAQGNILEVRREADAPRGVDGAGTAGSDIVNRFTYEPIFQQLRTVTGARGNDLGFTPQTNQPNIRAVDFDLDGAGTSDQQARYTTELVYDYQEGSQADIEALALAQGVSITATQAAALAQNLDLNGDGLSQSVGRLVETRLPNTKLDDGVTDQTVVENYRHNAFAQLVAVIDAAGYLDRYDYHPENDPDGDGVVNAAVGLTGVTGGYLKEITRDAALALRTPSTITKAAGALAPTHPARPLIDNRVAAGSAMRYDNAGNLVRFTDPRGIQQLYVVNERNQIQKQRRAADTSSLNPEEPEALTALDYGTERHFDANDNLVRIDVENKTGAANQLVAANPFLSTTRVFDLLDNLIELRREVSEGETVSLDAAHSFPLAAQAEVITRYRYDKNQNPALTISPVTTRYMDTGADPLSQSNNVQATVYDERDLPYQLSRGGVPTVFTFLSAPAGPNADIPETFIHDVASTAVVRLFRDANGNLKEAVDAKDHGEPDPSGIGGDISSRTYDGFDRFVALTDPMGYQALRRYDPESHIINVRRLGTAGGNQKGSPATNLRLSERRAFYDELGRSPRGEEDLILTPGAATSAVYVTRTRFDENSRPAVLTNPRGFAAERYHDGLDRAVLVQDQPIAGIRNDLVRRFDDASNLRFVTRIEREAAGEEEIDLELRYDAAGRPVVNIDALGNTRRGVFDSRDNPVMVTDANGDLIGQTTAGGDHFLNAPGNPVYTLFDGLNRAVLVQRDLHQGHNGSRPQQGSIATTVAYDPSSRVVGQRDALGNLTRYGFDPLDRQTTITYADLTQDVRSFDQDDLWDLRTDPNGTQVSAARDDLGRLVRQDILPGAGVEGTTLATFEHDGLSRITRATDNNGLAADSIVDRQYDSLSRISNEAQTQTLDGGGNVTHQVAYAFDENSNCIQQTYPSGRIITRTYDPIDRQTLIQDTTTIPRSIAAQTFIGPARLRSRQFATLRLDQTYDTEGGACDCTLGRVTRKQYTQGPQTLLDLSYEYDRNSWRTAEGVAHGVYPQMSRHKRYNLDSIGRLETEGRGPSPFPLTTNNTADLPDLALSAEPTAGDLGRANLNRVYDGAQNILDRTDQTVVPAQDFFGPDGKPLDGPTASPPVPISGGGQISSFTVTPQNDAAGAFTTYDLSFQTFNTLGAADQIRIEFPPGSFIFPNAGNISSATIDGGWIAANDGADQSVLVLTRDGTGTDIAPGTILDLRLLGIRNRPDNGSYRLRLATSQNRIAVSDPYIITLGGFGTPRGAITSFTVTPSNTLTVTLADYRLDFTTQTTIDPGGRFIIDFVPDLDPSGTSALVTSGTIDGGFLLQVQGNRLVIARDGNGTPLSPGSYDLTIRNILNGSPGAHLLYLQTSSVAPVLSTNNILHADALDATNAITQQSFLGLSQAVPRDLNGNVLERPHALGGTQRLVYDYKNRLVKVLKAFDQSVIAQYRYDAFDRRIRRKVTGGFFAPAANEIHIYDYSGQIIQENLDGPGDQV